MTPYRSARWTQPGRRRAGRRARWRAAVPIAWLWLGLAAPQTAAAQTLQAPELRRLSLEELMSVSVTTISRTPQATLDAAAAVYVITRDDIRRSGVTTLPEALRLVPGVHVARIDGSRWAIGMRGFTDRLARAMLVLIDGRAVYSPLFAGTYWEVQDLLLADIDRIEVVRGPGGTLWGANAVTGIVNIVTRHSSDTQGAFGRAGVGGTERALAGIRYSGRLNERTWYRAYGKFTSRSPHAAVDGGRFDDKDFGQGGLRIDGARPDGARWGIQGDFYHGEMGQRAMLNQYTPPFSQRLEGDMRVTGGNVIGRWQSPGTEGLGLRAQAYYDWTRRDELVFAESRHTFDLDLQRTTRWRAHLAAYGVGYRYSFSDSTGVETLRFLPEDRGEHLLTFFVQDEMELLPNRVRLTGGLKLEHNRYTGIEAQPSVRIAWAVTPRQTAWGAVTRAVRTPSRVEQDLELTSLVNPAAPLYVRLLPNPDFDSESLVAFEAGYRAQLGESWQMAVSSFYNRHDNVLSTEVFPTFVESDSRGSRAILPIEFGNGLRGTTRGVELTSDVLITPWWRVNGSYSFLGIDLTRKPGSTDGSQERRGEGMSPRHQLQWQASFNLRRNVELDWNFRASSALPAIAIPRYQTSDIRIGWSPSPDLEFDLVGQNLHQSTHLEFEGGAIGNVAIRRSGFARVTFRW
jgi:iron complex outermembrane receptor protein